MASSNNSIAEKNKKKKTKKPETSTPTSQIKKNKNIDKSKDKNKNNNKKEEENKNKNKNKKKLNFTNGNSKEKQENGKKKHHKNNDDDEEDEQEEAKTHVFPMNRVRTILKGEISDLRVSQEAVLAINKAAEKFIEQLAEEAYVCIVQDRKKALSYNHLSRVVSKQKRYEFLSDFVPEKVKAENALRETNSRGNRGG